MAIFHVATSVPTKHELIERWIPTQPWGPSTDAAVRKIGGFHFDDPEGRVGMETHLVEADGTIFQVPLTYRDTPLPDAEASLVGTLEHSALGTRWIYDGLTDDRFVMLLAGVALTGQGHALGMAEFEGRWYAVPEPVRLVGGGWSHERVAVDGFVRADDDSRAASGTAVFRNDRFELTCPRRPVVGPQPPIGLTATWDGQRDPVVLAKIREL